MVIAFDFDGVVCEDRFPEIGEPNALIIDWLKMQAEQGDKLILWTCRENAARDAAVEFCRKHEIPMHAVNDNPDNPYGYSRKVYADMYIDDKAVTPDDLIIREATENLSNKIREFNAEVTP
jgi:hypothetical protein